MSKLTGLAIKKAKSEAKDYKMADGGGLYLLVKATGSKCWRLKYRIGGKEKLLSFGTYPDVSLSDARERRDQSRKLLANRVDPSAIKQEAKQEKVKILQIAENSFRNLAIEFHKVKSPMWTEGHAKQWMGNLEKYAMPVIGNKPITDIEPMDIMQIMRDMEALGIYETRDRLLQTIGVTFKYAMATGRAKSNPADIRIALAERPPVVNFPSVSTAELPDFIRAARAYQNLDKVSPITISAFWLQILTATRSSEVRFSKWVDFDLDAGCWIVPAEQIGRKGKKGKRKNHAVPLCTQAIRMLRDLYSITGQGEFVFPNRNEQGGVISENTVNKIIETIGYKGRQVGHGFRALARTALSEMGVRSEALEAMLAHVIVDQTVAAYVRTTYFEERRGIMQQWADYLDGMV
jgi:integrase